MPTLRPSLAVDRLTNIGDGIQNNGTTVYYEIPVKDDELTSIEISTPDAAANGTYTLEVTNFDPNEVGNVASVLWCAVPLTITAPTSAASTFVSFSNLGAKRLRIKIVASANLQYRIRTHHGC
jgi:hypothetical protein